MIIRKTAFGNSQEAFIESRYKNTTNIILAMRITEEKP